MVTTILCLRPLYAYKLIMNPFNRVALDFIDPLSRSNQYVLFLVNYVSHFPEVIPLLSMQAKGVC